MRELLAQVGVPLPGGGQQQGTGVRPGGGEQIQSIPIAGGRLENLITNIINVILIVAGLLVVIYLIYGGILYITAGGDAEKAGKGRTAITNAIIGLVIIIASLLIYNYVIRQLMGGY